MEDDGRAEDAIVVEGLRKVYGDLAAVDGASFTVRDGEVFGILGPNGAGKTTTLETLEGLRPKDGGSATIYGVDVKPDCDELKRLIGVQLQATALFDYLSALETVELFAAFYEVARSGRAEIRSRAHEVLAQVSLTEKEGARIKELSGGQKQRLAIAVALVSRPRVLFLDEPTTGLDPAARRNLWGVVQDIAAAGMTIVITTHYMEEAELLCDRIAIMDRGKVVTMDTPRRLIESLGARHRVTFRAEPVLSGDDLVELEAAASVSEVSVDKDGLYTLRTDRPQPAMEALFSIARRGSVSVDHMHVDSANLEDVFLHYTGRELRD